MKLTCLLGILLSLSARAYPISFDFAFDNDPLPGIQSPLVGSGRFTFANDPGNGTFPFSSLGKYSMNFAFPDVGAFFNEADIFFDVEHLTVILSSGAFGRRLQFSDTGWNWFGLDLVNSAGYELNFEPSWVGEGLRLYYVNATDTRILGDYLARQVSDETPTAGLLAFSGLVLAAIASGHKRFRIQALGTQSKIS